MADFSKLINDITASIKANGVGDITGNVLQARLLELISAANEGKQDVIADLDTIRTNAQQAFTQIQTILGPDTTPAIVKFQEIINFLEGISDSESLDAIIKSIESQIAGKQDAIAGLTNDSFLAIKEDSENALKNAAEALNNTQGLISSKQDKITDLETIREGAALGKTALQKEVYTGTVSGVKMNNTTKNPVNGIVDLGTVITQHQDISGKVDKEEGKQLSTENFTTALKMKLEALNNYDDTELSKAILTLKTQLETLIGGNASDKIDSFNEIIAFLDSVKDSEDLASVIASIEEQIALKADTASLAKVATSGSYKDLSNVPTKLSDFLNDVVYLNQAVADTLYIRQDTPILSTFATKDDLKGKQDAITGLTNESFASIKENELTALQNAATALNTANGLVSTKQDKIDGLTNEVFATIQQDVDSALKNAASALNTANGLVSSKQDKITDLATIRSNASLGASAYSTLSSYNLQDISENASLGATAYGWGNHANAGYAMASALSGYLPKSGGILTGALTISGGADRKIIIDNTDADTNWNYISFCQNGVEYGRLGTASDTNLKWNGNTVIHSGNIGSQSVNYATSAGSVAWANVTDKPSVQSQYKNTGLALSAIDKVAGSSNLWNSNSNSWVFHNSNNALAITVGGTSNDRNAMIQVGHNTSGYGQYTGDLYLNKLGGKVYYGDKEIAVADHSHSYLPLSGGTLTGALTVSGEVTASAFYESSDETLKDFGKDIEIDFERLKNLPKKYFTWKSGGDKQIGTSAQEVQKLFPELVGKKVDGTLTVDYGRLTMPALAAIDKLYTENQELKADNQELKARLTKLEMRIYG